MNPNDTLLVTDKGAILMPDGRLAKPGDRVEISRFAKHQQQMQILLDAGNLSAEDVPVTGIDVQRVPEGEQAPPIPNEIDLKAGQGLRSGAGSGSNDAATMQRLDEIKKAQAAAKAAADERQARLAEVGEGVDLTPEEAAALGVIAGEGQ